MVRLKPVRPDFRPAQRQLVQIKHRADPEQNQDQLNQIRDSWTKSVRPKLVSVLPVRSESVRPDQRHLG